MSARKNTAAALCRLLTTGDEADRCHALRALGAMRDSASIPALIERLYDADPDVCTDAAEALGRIGDPVAIPDLLELLHNHPDGEVRSSVVEALGNFSDPRVEAALLICAAQRPENLVCDDEWDDWWDMQLHAVTALGRMRSTKSIAVLRTILEDEESQGIEAELLTALARIGGDGLEVLEQRLLRGSPAERRRAATALGHAADRKAPALLGEALLDQEAEVRGAAIRALGAAGASGYLKVILISLKDPDAGVRSSAAETCGLLAAGSGHSSDLAEQLVPLLDDADPLVRSTTIRTLDMLHGEQLSSSGATARITLRLSDPEAAVAAAACRFVARHRVDAARRDLLQIAADEQGSAYLRQQAVHALGALEDTDQQVIDTLCRAIRDPEQPVRLEALGSLMNLAGTDTPLADSALQAVLDAARGVSPGTAQPEPAAQEQPEPGAAPHPARGSANSTLEAIGMALADTAPGPRQPQPDSEELDDIREHLDLAEKMEALTAPGRADSDPATGIRCLAIRVLARSDREEAFATLIDSLQDASPGLRREAAISIGRIAARCADPSRLQHATGPLLSQMEFGEESIRHACARSLARLGSTSALPHLLGALTDRSSQVRIEAVNGLVDLVANGAAAEADAPVTEIMQQLQERLGDPASGVRLAAAKGLASLLPVAGEELPARQVVERIVAAARIDHGSQARDMGRILREIDREAAVDTLLQQLDSMDTSSERRFVIELLEELLAVEEAGERRPA